MSEIAGTTGIAVGHDGCPRRWCRCVRMPGSCDSPSPSTLLVHHDARTGHDERLRAQTVQTSQDARVDETRTRNKLCHKHARHRESVRFRSLSPLKVQWPEH